MRLGPLPQLKRLALALALVGLVLLIWVFWSSTAGLLAAAIVGFVVLVAICLWALPARLVAHDTAAAELEPEQRATAINAARTTLVQGLVGVAALAGILVAWQQLQTDREQSRTDRQQLREQLAVARQGQVAERFTRAVDQLGSDKLEQRLGGIYGLERIAKESPDGGTRLVVAEVLTAYVRQHAPQDPKLTSLGANELSQGDLEVIPAVAPDVQAIMTVLGRRTVQPGDPPLELSNVNLSKVNLSGANLESADLRQAQLLRTNLTGAKLQGADLTEAQLTRANLERANLQNADLSWANLEAANLFRTHLEGANLSYAGLGKATLYLAELRSANLTCAGLPGASLADAGLEGANLQGAYLKGTQLWRARLQRADLSRARLQGADLRGAQLQDAQSDKTRWPDGFDWRAAGVKLHNSSFEECAG